MSEPKTILIVDDDSDFVASMREIVESAGHRALTAYDGAEGFRVASTRRPDLILLDVMMAEPTEGFKVLQQIRATPAIATTPVILISSIYTDLPAFKVMPEAGQEEADLFLPKPVDPANLLEQVARLLEQGRRRPSARRP
jgi:two-component system response regulator Irr